VAATDQESAWWMVDLLCIVAVSSSLLNRFYRSPFYLRWGHVAEAYEGVSVDRALLTARGRSSFRVQLIGHRGLVIVWRNRNPGSALPKRHAAQRVSLH